MSSLITTKQNPGRFIDRTSPLARGLVAYLPMNEQSGAKSLDVMTGYYNGRFRGSPTWTGTPWGGGIKFNGSSDFIDLGMSGTISGATNATPIVITSTAHGLSTGRQVLVNGVGGNTAANGTWTVTVTGVDTFSLDTSVGNGAFSAGAGAWSVTVPSPDKTITTGSIAVRFKVAAIAADSYIASRVKSGSHDNECRLFINNANSNKLQFNVEAIAGTISITSDAAILVDTWYHAVCTWSANVTGSMKMYINGVLQAATGTPTVPVGVVGMPWNLGRNNALNTVYFNGIMDHFMIYDRMLPATDVRSLHVSPSQLWATPSYKYFKLGVEQSASASLSCTSTITATAKVAVNAICWANRLGVVVNTTVRDEISGIARSNIDSDLFWVANDSGGSSTIYALGRHGEDRGAWTVSGGTNLDWEDISSASVGGNNYIYVGDIGDNSSVYSTHIIYRIIEPVLSDDNGGTISSGDITAITVQYPETPQGETYNNGPGVAARRDAETLMVDPLTGDIYIISKRETQPRIFKLDHATSYVGTQTLTYVGQMTGVPDAIGGFTVGNAVGGDFAPDGLSALIKTYDSVYYWKRASSGISIGTMLLQAPFQKMPYVGIGLESGQQEPQGEAIVFDHDSRGYITVSETSGSSLVYLYYYSLGDQVNALGGFALSASASLADISTVTATARSTQSAIAALTSVSTITSLGSIRLEAIAPLSDISTVTATAKFNHNAISALSSLSTVSPTAVVLHPAVAALSAVASVSATVAVAMPVFGAAALSSVSSVSAFGSLNGVLDAEAVLSAVAYLAGSGNITQVLDTSGGVSVGGGSDVKFRFRVTKSFKWNTGECISYHYRVESPCIDISCETTSVDDGNPGCPSRLIAFVQACSLKELCIKLAERNFVFPISSIKRYSVPANRSDITTELDSCARYEPIDSFSQIPECFNFGLAGDMSVNIKYGFSVEFCQELSGMAIIELGGESAFSGSVRTLNTTSEGGITLGGEGIFESGNYLGEIEFDILYDLSADVSPSFLRVEDELPVPIADSVTTDCVCSVPELIQISHNLGKTGVLREFIIRNNLTLPNVLNLTYSAKSESWSANSYLNGLGDTSNQTENWNITFQWKCTNSLGPYDLGPTLWVLTIYIVRKNTATGKHSDTKMLFGFSYDQTCRNQKQLVFKFNLNTVSEEVISNSSVDTELKLNYDNIGLFTSNNWLKDPNLKIGISVSEGQPVLERFSLREPEISALDL